MFADSSSRAVRLAQVVVVGFVLVTCLKVWLGPGRVVERAYGQVPNAAAQRIGIIDEIRKTNQLLEQIKEALKTETFDVRIADGAREPGKPVAPARKKQPGGE